MKFNNILLPTDFSEQSNLFLKEIIHSKDLNVENIYILHVIRISDTYLYTRGYIGEPINLGENLMNAAEQNMQDLEKTFQYEKSVNLSTHVRQSLSVADEIVTFANDNKIDSIIMPTHARTGANRFFLGSVTEEVIRISDCPVLVIRNKNI